MRENQRKTIQLGKCLVQDVNFNGNHYSYLNNAIQFNK